MIGCLYLNSDRYQVVNFGSLYKKKIEPLLLADLRKYSCTGEGKMEKTARRFFQHHIIHEMCEYVIGSKQHKVVFYININDLVDTETWDLFADGAIRKLLGSLTKTIQSKLPLRVYTSDYTFDCFVDSYKSGKNIALKINVDIELLASRDTSSFLFDKIKTYVKKTDLSFLDQVYFNRLRSKMLLLS